MVMRIGLNEESCELDFCLRCTC